MKQISIKARVPADKDVPDSKELTATIAVNYVDLDGDIDKAYDEAAQMFGKKAVLSNAFANWRVTLQSGIRAGLSKGETQESLQTRFGTAKMGVATTGGVVDVEASFAAKFAAATKEEREKMIARLQAQASKK